MEPIEEAIDATVRALEASHDAAHVSSRVAEEMDRLRRMSELELAGHMVFQCRETAKLHRSTALYFGQLLMWFGQHPDERTFRTRGNTVYTRELAGSEYRLARHLHRRVCRQLGDWMRRQHAALNASLPDIPRPANDPNPNSRVDAA